MVSHYKGCACMQATQPDETKREKRDGHCMRNREPMTCGNEALSFTVWKQNPPIPLSSSPTVSLSSQRLSSLFSLLLEIAFNAPVPELWWTELRSAVLRVAQQKWRDFTLQRQRSSWIKPHLVACFLLQDDSKGGDDLFCFKQNTQYCIKLYFIMRGTILTVG